MSKLRSAVLALSLGAGIALAPTATTVAAGSAGATAPLQGGGGAGTSGTGTTLQRQMDQLNAQLEQLQGQMTAQRQNLAQANSAAAAAEHRLGVQSAQVQAKAAYVDGIENSIGIDQQQLTAETAALAAADRDLVAAQQRADDGLRVLYEGGTVRFVNVLFGSASFTQFLTRFHFLQDIFASDVSRLQQVQVARAALDARRAALQQQEDALAALQAQAADALQQLSVEESDDRKAANAAQAEAWAQAQEVQADAAASAHVTAELADLHIQYDRAQGKLVFDWPLPAPHVITDPYGPRINPITHLHEIHTGVDIAEPMGTPIHAAAAGVVAFVGWQTGYGNCTIIYHGKVDGHTYYTLYGHQSKFGVTLHEVVGQGQVIGYIGMTGWATGPHLHFEIRVDGTPVNPMPYLPQTGIQIDY